MAKTVNINDFLPEAYRCVFEKKPFNFINKYYLIVTGRKQLYDRVHIPWLDKTFFYYRKYQAANYDNHDAQALSMMDSLEDIIDSNYNKKLYIAEDD